MAKRHPSLQDDLDELERTDPEVRAAADKYAHALWRWAFRERIKARRNG